MFENKIKPVKPPRLMLTLTNALAPLTREELETALDTGRLLALMSDGRWLRLARNGATIISLGEENKFSLPAKGGRATYLTLDKRALSSSFLRVEGEKK